MAGRHTSNRLASGPSLRGYIGRADLINAAEQLQTLSMSHPPLHGVRVIELARILAGPWAGQMLADLGADVIKVENPDGGDDTRKWGPPFVTGQDGENLSAAYYHSCNRGKRSIAVDFSTPEGAETVRKLVADADVLIENFKLGGLKKYGLDYESVRRSSTRSSSTARSPASARTDPMLRARATISSSRACPA